MELYIFVCDKHTNTKTCVSDISATTTDVTTRDCRERTKMLMTIFFGAGGDAHIEETGCKQSVSCNVKHKRETMHMCLAFYTFRIRTLVSCNCSLKQL